MSRKPYSECSKAHQLRINIAECKEEIDNFGSDSEDEMESENIENFGNHEHVENVANIPNDAEKPFDVLDSLDDEEMEINNDENEVEETLDDILNTFYDFQICDDNDEEWESSSDSSGSSTFEDVEESDESEDEFVEEKVVNAEKCLISKYCPLLKDLKELALKLTRELCNELLKILQNIGHKELPNDRRALVGTPRRTEIVPCDDGEYFHYGLKEAIKDILKKHSLEKNILVDIGIDGLPLSRSSNQKLWPIIGKIIGNETISPFVIGAYFGSSEPSEVSPFLDKLIEELKELETKRLFYNGVRYKITLNRIICDIPAKNKVTCTKYYTGFYGCTNCVVVGESYKNRTIFLNQDCDLRTDDSFRKREQIQHHHGESPFEDLDIDMVKSFPIDYMHAVCLGVMRLMLIIWFRGNKKQTIRPILGSRAMQIVSNAFFIFGKHLPKEFNRKPQPLTEIGRWKATVLRYFLLYAGPAILKNVLPKKLYQHFNLFSCAIRILCDPIHYKLNNYIADNLLRKFVSKFGKYYGNEYITINLHSLTHLAQDCLNNDGPLDTFSAFAFENYMQFIKKILKKRNKPLQQLHRRLKEGCCPKRKEKVQNPTLKNELKRELPFNCGNAHRRLLLPNVEFSINSPDNCCILENDVYVVISGIGQKNGVPVVIGQKFEKSKNLDNYPVNSDILNICTVSNLSKKREVFEVDKIKGKACLFFYDNIFYASKLLHF